MFRWLLVACLPLFLQGCGTHVPSFAYSKETHAEAFKVNTIVNRVKCELREAVRATISYDPRNEWLRDWAADLQVKMTADELSNFVPSISVGFPLRNSVTTFSNGAVTLAQSAGFGLGADISTQAVRLQTSDYYFSFADDFLSEKSLIHPIECKGGDGLYIHSDLKLKEWLDSVTFPYLLPDNVQMVKPQTFTYDTKFNVRRAANGGPILRIVPVVLPGTSLPFFSTSRRTENQIIITIGPAGRYGLPTQTLQQASFVAKLSASVRDRD